MSEQPKHIIRFNIGVDTGVTEGWPICQPCFATVTANGPLVSLDELLDMIDLLCSECLAEADRFGKRLRNTGAAWLRDRKN